MWAIWWSGIRLTDNQNNKIILGRKIINPTRADIVAETKTAAAAKSLGAVVW